VSEDRQRRLEPTLACPTCPARPSCDEGQTEYGCGNDIPPDAPFLHPGSPDLTIRLAEVGGLDLRIRLKYQPRPLPSIPTYIPRVQPRAGFEGADWPAFAVPIDRVGTTPPVLLASELRRRLGLSSKARLILSMHQQDDVLETVWGNRRQLVQSLADANFDLVLVPSFSNWDQRTRIEHRYQVARGLRFLELLVRAGVPSAPNVVWYLDQDIRDWIRELRGWVGPRAFSVDLQTLQTDEKWQWGIRGLRLLCEGIGAHWEVIINGVARADRIQSLLNIFGHFHLINARPYELAMANRITIDELLVREIRTDPANRMKTFSHNVRTWARLMPVPPLCSLSAHEVRTR